MTPPRPTPAQLLPGEIDMPTDAPVRIRQASRKVSAADHAGSIRSFYPFWDLQYRMFLIQAVEALPEKHFDWKPHRELLTGHQMIQHIAQWERGWVDHLVDGGPLEEWIIPADDPADGWKTTGPRLDHAGLVALLEQWHRPTQRWFEKPATELGRVITFQPPDGPELRFTL